MTERATDLDHATDLQLVDLVAGDLDAATAARVADHARTCLACRMQLDRIAVGLPDLPNAVAPAAASVTVAGSVLAAVAGADRPRSGARPGELWRARSSRRRLGDDGVGAGAHAEGDRRGARLARYGPRGRVHRHRARGGFTARSLPRIAHRRRVDHRPGHAARPPRRGRCDGGRRRRPRGVRRRASARNPSPSGRASHRRSTSGSSTARRSPTIWLRSRPPVSCRTRPTMHARTGGCFPTCPRWAHCSRPCRLPSAPRTRTPASCPARRPVPRPRTPTRGCARRRARRVRPRRHRRSRPGRQRVARGGA